MRRYNSAPSRFPVSAPLQWVDGPIDCGDSGEPDLRRVRGCAARAIRLVLELPCRLLRRLRQPALLQANLPGRRLHRRPLRPPGQQRPPLAAVAHGPEGDLGFGFWVLGFGSAVGQLRAFAPPDSAPLFSTTRLKKHPAMWSSTIPADCMKA